MSSYTTESDTLIHLLRHLNNNRTDAVIGDPNISKNIQAALSDYSKYDVTILDINNLYLLQKADTDFLLQIIYESKDIDPDFKVFVSNNKIHKEALQQDRYTLSLVENTTFNQNISKTKKEIKQRIEQLIKKETSLEEQKNKTLEKWDIERSKLYSNRKTLIERNKVLFKERKVLSQTFYSSDKEIRSKKDFIEQYRNILEENEKNKKSILEINKQIELLDRKTSLYISGTFYYSPAISITILPISKEDLDEYLQKKGGKYRNYDVDFLEGDSFIEESSVQSYYEKLKKNIKKMSKTNKVKSNKQLFKELNVK